IRRYRLRVRTGPGADGRHRYDAAGRCRPFSFYYDPQAEAIGKYETELEKLLKDRQDEFTERNLELKEGVFTAVADPRKPSVPPPMETVPPFLNFAPMKNAIEQLKKSSERYSKALAAWQAKGSREPQPDTLSKINSDLLGISRLFLNPKG